MGHISIKIFTYHFAELSSLQKIHYFSIHLEIIMGDLKEELL